VIKSAGGEPGYFRSAASVAPGPAALTGLDLEGRRVACLAGPVFLAVRQPAAKLLIKKTKPGGSRLTWRSCPSY
jgi:hypothetical protein